MRQYTVSRKGSRLAQLKNLRDTLGKAIDGCESMRDLAALSRQYRETIREIEDLEGGAQDGDEIGDLLAERRADGKPGAVRTHRTGSPGN